MCYNYACMNKINKEAKSLSSSSAFIIIIVLVVVSVAAIVVGGGDGFSRKYAGIDLREFGGRLLLAQTGVVGKILEFQQENGQFNLNLRPIELDGSLLAVNQRYTTTVVPPREGDTPFSYRPEEELRVTQGYPLLRSYVEENNLVDMAFDDESQSLPNILGMVDCSANALGGGFSVFFEDIAYNTGVGFDDSDLGQTRQDAVCSVLGEFESMLLLDQTNLEPGIVVQSSVEGTPDHSLSVVSPQYVGGSGFVSTLLADYLRSGVKRSRTSFSDTVSVLGINSGFMRFNFKNIDWSVDTGDTGDFDLATVTRQNMLRLLGFGSFLGHEQENILSSSWQRWTEWDRLLLADLDNLIDFGTLTFSPLNYDSFEGGNPDNFDSRILASGGGVGLWGTSITDASVIPSALTFVPFDIFTPQNWQKGQSVSGLSDPTSVSYPILNAGDVKQVNQQEKEILCFLGLAVDGVGGCSKPRSVIQNIYIERQNNRAVCVNIFDKSHNAFASNFQLAGDIENPDHSVDISDASVFTMYDQPCDAPSFVNLAQKLAFDNQHATDDYTEAVAFAWVPVQEGELYPEDNQEDDLLHRQYAQFKYKIKDTVSNRITDRKDITIHKCVITATSNQLCNGSFQFSAAKSPIDFKLSSLENFVSTDGTDIIGCKSTTLPGWCSQGSQDGFSSEFGYTWHPYLIEGTQAFDNQIISSPRKYAGGSSGAIIQRFRVPLSSNIYTVTGRVFVTRDGLQPTFWYGSQGSILKQSDNSYHIDYPETLANPNSPSATEYVLTETLTAGEWHTFAWSFTSGQESITHMGFGGSNSSGFVLYDDLSVKISTECGSCFTDVDGNCVTNTNDFITLLTEYGGVCPNQSIGCFGDLTFDGVINTNDLIAFLTVFGSVCQPDNPVPVDPLTGGVVENFVQTIPNYGENIIILSENSSQPLEDLVSIQTQLAEKQQVVPNSGGFSANYVMTVTNNSNKNINNLKLIGVIPSMMLYGDHVSTSDGIAYIRSSNTLVIEELKKSDQITIYFEVDISQNICGQVQRESFVEPYELLVKLDLCDSYQEIQEKQYGLRDKEGNLIPRRRGSGVLGGVPNCNDGIDNDADGFIDLSDSGCNLDIMGNESDAFVGGTTQCNDEIDNDGDGRIDRLDPHCPVVADNYEAS